MSYSVFLCPETILTQPKEANWDTFLCKTHENLQYMTDNLFSLGIHTSKNLEEMTDATACDMTKKKCTYGQCKMTTCSLFRSIQNKELNRTQGSLEKISRENGRRWTGMNRKLHENLGPNECLIHVDFSENYSCKYAKEIQAILHTDTGVFYVRLSQHHSPSSLYHQAEDMTFGSCS